MKLKVLLSIIICLNISCKKSDVVDYEIFEVISEYTQKYPLKSPNVFEDYSSKQSFEIGFFKNNEKDTLFYIIKMEAYGLKEIGIVGSGTFSYKLNTSNKRIIEHPFYMGTFFYSDDSIPIHVYDVFEKFGKSKYDFNLLKSVDFKDYIITEGQEIYTPNLWLYKIKNNKFLKIAETDTMIYKSSVLNE